MGRDAVFQRNELFEPFGLGLSEGRHILIGFGAAHDRDGGDQQDFSQRIVARSGSRVFDFVNNVKKPRRNGLDVFFIV